MKRFFLHLGHGLLALSIALSSVGPVFAQEVYQGETETQELTATIIGPEDTPVGRTVILDASASRVLGTNIEYFWYINNEQGPISRTVDAIYTPDRPGTLRFRLVIRSIVNGEPDEDEEFHTVIVYKRKVLLLADKSVSDADIEILEKAAASGSTYLRVLQTNVPATDRGGEDALVNLLAEKGSALLDAETIILWVENLPMPGLHALLQAVSGDIKKQRDMQSQTLLLPTNLNLRTVARTVKGPAARLQAERAFVVRPALLPLLLTAQNDEQFVQQARDIPTEETLLLDAAVVNIPSWWALTHLTSYMLSSGVSTQTVLLLLVLPVIATILSFLKQIVGMTTFGLFTPAIISLSFLVLGWGVGVLFLLFILMTGYAARALTRWLRILYIPKMAIILGIGSITLLLLVGIGTFFGILLSSDTVFVLLIMSTLVESFLNVKSEQGLTSAVLAIGQTIVAALLCVAIVQWPAFRALIIAYPEVILTTIVVNIALGRFTGLRISEYFRFREVFKHLAQEE